MPIEILVLVGSFFLQPRWLRYLVILPGCAVVLFALVGWGAMMLADM